MGESDKSSDTYYLLVERGSHYGKGFPLKVTAAGRLEDLTQALSLKPISRDENVVNYSANIGSPFAEDLLYLRLERDNKHLNITYKGKKNPELVSTTEDVALRMKSSFLESYSTPTFISNE